MYSPMEDLSKISMETHTRTTDLTPTLLTDPPDTLPRLGIWDSGTLQKGEKTEM
jgi:hypothetical protein